MQTFLPYPSFYRSVRVLDNRRLGKQRVEAFQILNVLERRRLTPDAKIAWRNHPAVIMWLGYDEALKLYYNFCVAEWVRRGNRNNMLYKTVQCRDFILEPGTDLLPSAADCAQINKQLRLAEKQVALPAFVGCRAFHISHQSNLLRKDEPYYRQFFATTPPDLEYVWPGRPAQK